MHGMRAPIELNNVNGGEDVADILQDEPSLNPSEEQGISPRQRNATEDGSTALNKVAYQASFWGDQQIRSWHALPFGVFVLASPALVSLTVTKALAAACGLVLGLAAAHESLQWEFREEGDYREDDHLGEPWNVHESPDTSSVARSTPSKP